MKLKNPKAIGGFTLIEMIIVIAIIGILAGLVLRETFVFTSTARDTKRIGDLKNTQNYLELYYNTCGYYPGASQASGTCGSAGASNWESDLKSSGVVSDLSKIPSDPSTSKPYSYGVSTDGLSYVLGAQLENYNNALSSSPTSAIDGVNCSSATNFYCVTSQ